MNLIYTVISGWISLKPPLSCGEVKEESCMGITVIRTNRLVPPYNIWLLQAWINKHTQAPPVAADYISSLGCSMAERPAGGQWRGTEGQHGIFPISFSLLSCTTVHVLHIIVLH